jgi:uncharacterized membrane protein (GlpM family)
MNIMSFVIKVIVSGLIVALASETARKFVWLGALIVTLSLTSLIIVTIIYVETRDTQKVAGFLASALWGILPPLIFFITCPLFIKHGFNFWLSMGLSCTAMVLGYISYSLLMRNFF